MASRSSKRTSWLVAGGWWLALGAAMLAQQPDRARTEALARRAAERLQTLQREADDLASQEQSVLGDLRKLELERQLKARQQALDKLRADAQHAQAAADRAAQARNDLIRDIDRRRDLNAQLAGELQAVQ